ncbi:MAG: acyltransferase [Pseudomonadota bacterium]
MPLDHKSYLDVSHFRGLDGLRAIAIIAVVWHHTLRPDNLPMFVRGFAGVDLFFVLSGFLIATLLIREKARFGRVSLRNFWARRFLRLMPAYYLLLFGMLAAYLVLKPDDPDTARLVNGFHIYALYLSNWFHPGANNLGITWSLATEEQFYLIWPFVFAFFRPSAAAAFWVAALFINQLINFGVLDASIDQIFGDGAANGPEILDTTFTPILLGVGLAHLLSQKRGFEAAAKIAGFRYAPWVFAGILLVLFNIPAQDISGIIRLSMHLAMTAWIASIVMAPRSGVTSALSWRPVAFIGAISYGMYLYHMWCVHIVRVVSQKIGLPAAWTEFPLTLMLTMAVSAASFYLYEKRFLDWRKRFRK